MLVLVAERERPKEGHDCSVHDGASTGTSYLSSGRQITVISLKPIEAQLAPWGIGACDFASPTRGCKRSAVTVTIIACT